MKGDFLLLGSLGVAMLVVPLAVVLGSGGTAGESSASTLAPAPPAVTAPVVQESTGDTAGSASWQVTSIPGGQPASSPQLPTPSSAKPVAALPENPVKGQAGASSYRMGQQSFKILNRSTGKVEEVKLLDYLRGAIAAEMPASFHSEALKAQGVAALTYALYHVGEQERNPDPLLLGAHFSADPGKREGYMTEKEAKKFYGDNWRYNWEKVCEAADEAIKWVVLYDNAPIAAAYHAISAGSTEDARNIWGQPMSCLTPVDSSWDILAKGYKSTVVLSQSEIKERLGNSDVTLLPNPDTWLEVLERSPSGYVTRVQVGNTEMNGNKLRNLLGLRSSSFQIERQGKDFLFLVNGYGHGAGLSQNGADYMARQGSDFLEILEHYYPQGKLTPTAK